MWCQWTTVKVVQQHATHVLPLLDHDRSPSRALDIVLNDDWFIVAVYVWSICGVDSGTPVSVINAFCSAFDVQPRNALSGIDELRHLLQRADKLFVLCEGIATHADVEQLSHACVKGLIVTGESEASHRDYAANCAAVVIDSRHGRTRKRCDECAVCCTTTAVLLRSDTTCTACMPMYKLLAFGLIAPIIV